MSSATPPLIILILSNIITPVLSHDNGHDAATMSDAWVLVLPLAVMLSLARSRYTLASQSVFLAFNALGVLVGAIYNAATPDLYPNNAHHKAGWVFTWISLAQVCIGLFGRTTRYFRVRLHTREASSDTVYQAVTSEFIESVGDNCQHYGLQSAYGRLFEGRAIYGGMAHWIKGGVFFWLGIFTLGRWSGSFGELGWAWNARAGGSQDKWYPSAELVESALIFSYGATNVFLEHLSNTDKTWTPRDLEHVSITILFIGGGLLGMLVESTRARDLLYTTGTEVAFPAHEATRMDGERTEKQNAAEPPKHYDFSINPVPALVILLLGTTMSSHHQSTMDSTMMHKQWGNLLTGASIARGFTYVLVYLKPPRSILPSRPPTELMTSFCLITGGIIFMASSTDTVEGLRHYNLDAMFVYTVVTGIVGLLMAWVIIVLAVKGAAVRQQRRAQTSARTSNERQGV
ncbi:putative membrane protein C3B8.06 like [Verticillium longisporum]|nr:putative membrane protein C3B8.06 like [Verticillium longisporum]